MKRYKGRTVLVTGATGFIAGRLVERLLLEEGAGVRVLIRNWTNASWVARLHPDFVEGDVTDSDSVDAAVRGCDAVFHCASGGDSYDGFMRTNVDGTDNVLQASQRHAVERIVYVSSITVHGSRFPAVVDEDTPTVKTGRGYSDSKVAAEELIRQRIQQDTLPVVVVRPSFVWGPRAGQFTVGLMAAIKAGALRVMDGGGFGCPAVYVDNLVDLLLLAGLKPAAIGQTFLATDGQAYTWSEFLNYYAKIVGAPPLRSLSSSSALTRIASVGVERLGNLLEKYQGNPAPLWKKVVRRSARILHTGLMNRGYPDPWYLDLYSNRSEISIDRAHDLLGYNPRFSLQQAMAMTEQWVLDQLGVRLGLTDAWGVQDREPVFAEVMLRS